MTNVDDLRNQILEEAHGSCYSIHPGSTKMYHDLREVFWWEVLKGDISGICCKMSKLPTSESRAAKAKWFTSTNPSSLLEVGRHTYGLHGRFSSDTKET